MGWIRRETEKGTTQYICPNCHDYHEFREDFGEQTFSENFIFCRRCGARNGTGTSAPPHPAADVAEVVRCKDCQYYQDAKTNKKGFLICPAFGMEITETDYCSYGVRMEVED